MQQQEDVLWQAILGEAQTSLSDFNFKVWFEPAGIVKIDGEQITISHPNPFAKETFKQKYHSMIRDILKEKGFSDPTIEYVVKKKNGSEQKTTGPILASTPTTSPRSQQHTQHTSNLNERFTFENFVMGDSNEFAYNAAIGVSRAPGKKHNPLFIYGGVGLGKTHLAQATGNEIVEKLGLRVKYTTTESFRNNFMNHIRNKKTGDFGQKYRDVDVLIIDDIQSIAGGKATQQEFFNTFNALHQQNKQIIITSDQPPGKIPDLTDRLRSRLQAGLIIDIAQPDSETRQAIIELKCHQMGLLLDNSVVKYITENVTSNVREIEGVLNKIDSFVEFRQVEPSIELVKSFISQYAPLTTKHISAKQIIDKVAETCELKPADITGLCRQKNINEARQIVMFLIRQELKWSYPAIKTAVGRKDHTTVMNGIDSLNKKMTSNPILKEKIKNIKEGLYA